MFEDRTDKPVVADAEGDGLPHLADDFGAGSSSLSYGRPFPLSRSKIDRSFVKDVETDLEGRAMPTWDFEHAGLGVN